MPEKIETPEDVKNGKVIILNNLPEFRHDNETHKIQLGQVVDLTIDDGCASLNIHKDINGNEVSLHIRGTVRLIVVGHHRDCDGTPLYILSDRPIGMGEWTLIELMEYKKWCEFLTHGWPESALKLVEGSIVPIKHKNIYDYIESLRY